MSLPPAHSRRHTYAHACTNVYAPVCTHVYTHVYTRDYTRVYVSVYTHGGSPALGGLFHIVMALYSYGLI